jgi:hypothetical protein
MAEHCCSTMRCPNQRPCRNGFRGIPRNRQHRAAPGAGLRQWPKAEPPPLKSRCTTSLRPLARIYSARRCPGSQRVMQHYSRAATTNFVLCYKSDRLVAIFVALQHECCGAAGRMRPARQGEAGGGMPPRRPWQSRCLAVQVLGSPGAWQSRWRAHGMAGLNGSGRENYYRSQRAPSRSSCGQND